MSNRFVYGIDYVLLDAERPADAPWPFSRRKGRLFALRDEDHGGPPGHGRGAAWVRDVLAENGIAHLAGRIDLLAQPRVLGHVFNPVSFWLIYGAEDHLIIVIAEVTNTFGDRHSYLCHRDDLGEIRPSDRLTARKSFHVSPFQQVAGGYVFSYDIRTDSISIRIDFTEGQEGLVATLTGPRRPLTTGSILRAALRRPLGARRVLALIHWQALKLWWKGAGYRPRPEPPAVEVSRTGQNRDIPAGPRLE